MTHYRPEIDGLRAIAVVAVILYHADFVFGSFKILSGGYIGVDVFFVISGYLISSLIRREIEAGKFSFLDFYERRARRILPALLLMMLASISCAWILFLPSTLKEFAGSSIAALFSVSNIWFWQEDSYTAQVSQFKPLLHTWSLGIEEQFYFVFPPLLFALKKYIHKLLFPALICVFTLSLIAAVIDSHRFPDAAFYLLYTRGWELMAGALLALSSYPPRNSHEIVFSKLPFIGLMLILISMFFFDEKTTHPSIVTLIPVVGTLLYIRFGVALSRTTRLLSSTIIVQIGLWSYSLYLWHFPVFAFAKTRYPDLSPTEKMALIAVTSVFAIVSYYAFERPMRNKVVVKRFLFWLITCFIFVIVFSISVWIYVNDGVHSRLGSMAALFEQANIRHVTQNGRKCANRPAEEYCKFGIDSSAHTVVLYGDSHANALAASLLESTRENNFNFHLFTKAGCLQIPGTIRWINNNKFGDCENRSYFFKELIAVQPPSTIIYSARFPLYLDGTRFDNGEGGLEQGEKVILKPDALELARGETVSSLLQKMVREWLKHGHTVVLVFPVPEAGWHIPQFVKRTIDNSMHQLKVSKNIDQLEGAKFRKFQKMDVTTNLAVYEERIASTRMVFDELDGLERLLFVYPAKIFCSETSGRCKTHDDEHLFYMDEDHLSPHAASKLVQEIENTLRDYEITY